MCLRGLVVVFRYLFIYTSGGGGFVKVFYGCDLSV